MIKLNKSNKLSLKNHKCSVSGLKIRKILTRKIVTFIGGNQLFKEKSTKLIRVGKLHRGSGIGNSPFLRLDLVTKRNKIIPKLT